MSSQQSKEKRNQLENIDRDFAIGLAAPSDQQNRMPDRPLPRSLLLGINLGLHDTGGLGGGGGGGTGSGSLIEAFTEWYENLTTEDIDPITAGLQTVAVPPDADGVGGDTAPVILIKGLAYELDQWSSSIIEGFLEWWETVTDEPFNTMREIADDVWIEAKKVLDWYEGLTAIPEDGTDPIADPTDHPAVIIIKGLIAAGEDWVNGVKNAIEDGIEDIVDLIKPKLEDAYDILEDTVEDIVEATQTALEATYTWLKAGVNATVVALQGGLEATYTWLSTNAATVVTNIQDALESTYTFLGTAASAALDWVADLNLAARNAIDEAGVWVGNAVSNITTAVEGAYDWLSTNVITAAENVWTSLKTTYTWLKDSAAGVVTALGTALGATYTFLADAASEALTWVADLNLAARNAIDEAGVWVGNAVVNINTAIVPVLRDLGNSIRDGLVDAGVTVLDGVGGIFSFFEDVFVTIIEGIDAVGVMGEDKFNIDMKMADIKNVDRVFFNSNTNPNLTVQTEALISGYLDNLWVAVDVNHTINFIVDGEVLLTMGKFTNIDRYIDFGSTDVQGFGPGTFSNLNELFETSLEEDDDYLMILDGSVNAFKKIKASALGGGGSTFNPLSIASNVLPANSNAYRLGAGGNVWIEIFGRELRLVGTPSNTPTEDGAIWLGSDDEIHVMTDGEDKSLSDIGGGGGTITINDLPNNIPFSKMQNLSTNRIVTTNSSGDITAFGTVPIGTLNTAMVNYNTNNGTIEQRLAALE